MPSSTGLEWRQFHPLRVEVGVEDEKQARNAATASVFASIKLIAKRLHARIVPPRMTQVWRKPSQVRYLIIIQVSAEKKLPVLQHREAAREGDGLTKKLEDVAAPRQCSPVEPTDFVVLAISIVVAALRARKLVAPEDHGCS